MFVDGFYVGVSFNTCSKMRHISILVVICGLIAINHLKLVVSSDSVKRQSRSIVASTEANTNSVASPNDHSIKLRRARLDSQLYESIYEKFQVNKNSIIRTHDSRSLGAKYLNETELASNDDCLRWCWNTTNCNLAVYEEKTRGSCYLFDCGPLDDFKCRFTAHNFYSSSVLQVNRNSYFLHEWKSQVNQENELAGLKVKQLDRPTDHRENEANKMEHVEKAPVTPAKVSKCRHYQFECRNSSECIAIYNVCDGIPQCPDASDEAVELECHKSRYNSFKPSDSDNDKTKASVKEEKVNSPVSPSIQYGVASNAAVFNTYSKPPPDSHVKLSQYSSNYYNYPRSPNDKLMDENMLVPNRPLATDYAGSYGIPSWNQYSLPVGETKPESRIGSFGAEADQYGAAMKDSLYWPSFNYQAGTPSDFQPHSLSRTPNEPSFNFPTLSNDARNRIEFSHSLAAQPQLKYSSPTIYNQYSGGNQVSPIAPKPVSLAKNDSNKINASGAKVIVATVASAVVVNNGSSKVEYSNMMSSEKNVEVKDASIVAISYMHDSTAQSGRETNSAVIALTLGLFITSILIVIVGCRMKSFKKRIARRGRSLAHDADYLINGMYL